MVSSSTNGNSAPDVDLTPFVKVTDVSKLIPILEKRLPNTAFIYNSAKIYERFSDVASFYTLNGEIDDGSWIVYLHYREDYGQDYLISADEQRSKISKDEATKIFSECKLFKWDERFFFGACEKWFSPILYHISMNIMGNTTVAIPDYLYTMDIEECLKLEIISSDPSVEIKRLDPDMGVKFILDTWKYSIEGSDVAVRRVVERNESAGVYVNGKPVCGVILNGFGMISALYTLEEYRGKGYAKLCMQFIFKEMAKNGLVPGSSVELRNDASLKFHDKLGCKRACPLDYILYYKPSF